MPFDRLICRMRSSIFWLLFKICFYLRLAFIRDITVYAVFNLVENSRMTENCAIINGQTIKTVSQYKYLGVAIDRHLTWNDHINYAASKANRQVALLKLSKYLLLQQARIMFYKSLIRPLLEYCSVAWCNSSTSTLRKLKSIEGYAVTVITDSPSRTRTMPLLKLLHLPQLMDQFDYFQALIPHSHEHGSKLSRAEPSRAEPARARAPRQPPFTRHSEKASQPGQWACLSVSTLETYGYLLRNARATFSLIMDRRQASSVFFSLALEQSNAEVRMVSRRTVLLRRRILDR